MISCWKFKLFLKLSPAIIYSYYELKYNSKFEHIQYFITGLLWSGFFKLLLRVYFILDDFLHELTY